jgi:flagellar motility protein MotE (MotC chaperone)
MIRRLSSIRLLPVTIFALASLLAVKSTVLVRAATTTSDISTPAVTPASPPAAPEPPPPSQGAIPKPPAPPAHATAASPQLAAPKPSEQTTPPPVTDAERTVLLELRQRREQLDTRDAALTARESLLTAAEQKLTERVGELQALQKKLETLEAARKQREDAGLQGLVKLYEVMKPRDAATIFNDLDMPVLLQVVDRMKEAKAAPVLAAMQPDKARELTEKLAQLRSPRQGQAGG